MSMLWRYAYFFKEYEEHKFISAPTKFPTSLSLFDYYEESDMGISEKHFKFFSSENIGQWEFCQERILVEVLGHSTEMTDPIIGA